MRIGKAFLAVAVCWGLLSAGLDAQAHPPTDDFLNPQDPGPHLTLMPFVGPGFRATYDHRFKIEKDVSELRTQLIGTVAVPFAEVSANADVRFFLMNFGASVGYHDEWHVLQFRPDPKTGTDFVGQATTDEPALTQASRSFTDLTLDARAQKDANDDQQHKAWPFYEFRWGFLWPGNHFMGVSTLAARHEGRPNESFDWENGTVLNGGWNARWEAYALLRERNIGFIGPAVRAMYVPRNRIDTGNTAFSTEGAGGPAGLYLPPGSSCQPGVVVGLPCVVKHEFSFQYGFLAGMRPNWVANSDTLLVRVYTTAGLKDNLFGTQAFRLPLQILVAYMVDVF